MLGWDLKLILGRHSEDEIWLSICIWTCEMTHTSYFVELNSNLGSVVPLAMFNLLKFLQKNTVRRPCPPADETPLCQLVFQLLSPSTVFWVALFTTWRSNDVVEFSEILFFHHPAVPRDLIGSNRHIRMLCASFFIFGVPLILAKEAQKGPKIT